MSGRFYWVWLEREWNFFAELLVLYWWRLIVSSESKQEEKRKEEVLSDAKTKRAANMLAKTNASSVAYEILCFLWREKLFLSTTTGCYWETPASRLRKKWNSHEVKQWDFLALLRCWLFSKSLLTKDCPSGPFADGRKATCTAPTNCYSDDAHMIWGRMCLSIDRYKKYRRLLRHLSLLGHDFVAYMDRIYLSQSFNYRKVKNTFEVTKYTNVNRFERSSMPFPFRFDRILIDENDSRRGAETVRRRTLIVAWIDFDIKVRNNHHCRLLVHRQIIVDFRARFLIVEDPLVIIVQTV